MRTCTCAYICARTYTRPPPIAMHGLGQTEGTPRQGRRGCHTLQGAAGSRRGLARGDTAGGGLLGDSRAAARVHVPPHTCIHTHTPPATPAPGHAGGHERLCTEMCMCMRVNVSTHTYRCGCIAAHARAPLHAYIHVHVHTCMRTHVCSYTCMQTCTWSSVSMYTRVHTDVYTYTCSCRAARAHKRIRGGTCM